MKKQVIMIGGGDTYDTYEEYLKFLKNFQIDFERAREDKGDWKRNLAEALGDDFEVIFLAMPNKLNAKYLEWKIWFEKFIPHLNAEVILIGHSLGGTFLAKYLAENDFPKKISAAFLVSAVFDERDIGESLADFKLPESLEKFAKQAGKIFIYHSKDDPIVPFADFEKYKRMLPGAEAVGFLDRGHFSQSEFPEIIKAIREID